MIGSKKAAVALAALIGQKSFSADRKFRVVAALGRLKDPSAVKPLLKRSRRHRRPSSRRPSMRSVAIVKDKKDKSRDEVVRAVRPSA